MELYIIVLLAWPIFILCLLCGWFFVDAVEEDQIYDGECCFNLTFHFQSVLCDWTVLQYRLR